MIADKLAVRLFLLPAPGSAAAEQRLNPRLELQNIKRLREIVVRPGALERQLRTLEWLRAAGLSRGEVFVICDRMDAAEKREAEAFARDRIYLHVGTRAQLCAIVKMGWNDDEAGRTDDSRDGAERPVSEPGKRI